MKGGNLGDFKCLRKALAGKPTVETEGWKETWVGGWEAELRKKPDDQLSLELMTSLGLEPGIRVRSSSAGWSLSWARRGVIIPSRAPH